MAAIHRALVALPPVDEDLAYVGGGAAVLLSDLHHRAVTPDLRALEDIASFFGPRRCTFPARAEGRASVFDLVRRDDVARHVQRLRRVLDWHRSLDPHVVVVRAEVRPSEAHGTVSRCVLGGHVNLAVGVAGMRDLPLLEPGGCGEVVEVVVYAMLRVLRLRVLVHGRWRWRHGARLLVPSSASAARLGSAHVIGVWHERPSRHRYTICAHRRHTVLVAIEAHTVRPITVVLALLGRALLLSRRCHPPLDSPSASAARVVGSLVILVRQNCEVRPHRSTVGASRRQLVIAAIMSVVVLPSRVVDARLHPGAIIAGRGRHGHFGRLHRHLLDDRRHDFDGGRGDPRSFHRSLHGGGLNGHHRGRFAAHNGHRVAGLHRRIAHLDLAQT
mmetsp:Transcript_65137/g.199201  ORF Transcript_65137/g.199201 Transcript_65137/m.199201 type:complete len:387 (+) Transcript_65137:545-1705(+)